MLIYLYEQLPRLIALAFTGYSALLVCTRWTATRVMTTDRRFLMLFFLLELATVALGVTTKLYAELPVDPSSWATALLQSFLCAYLHYAIPGEYRHFHHRFTRRRGRVQAPRRGPGR